LSKVAINTNAALSAPATLLRGHRSAVNPADHKNDARTHFSHGNGEKASTAEILRAAQISGNQQNL